MYRQAPRVDALLPELRTQLRISQRPVILVLSVVEPLASGIEVRGFPMVRMEAVVVGVKLMFLDNNPRLHALRISGTGEVRSGPYASGSKILVLTKKVLSCSFTTLYAGRHVTA